MLHEFLFLSAINEDWYRWMQGNFNSSCHYLFNLLILIYLLILQMQLLLRMLKLISSATTSLLLYYCSLFYYFYTCDSWIIAFFLTEQIIDLHAVWISGCLDYYGMDIRLSHPVSLHHPLQRGAHEEEVVVLCGWTYQPGDFQDGAL